MSKSSSAAASAVAALAIASAAASAAAPAPSSVLIYRGTSLVGKGVVGISRDGFIGVRLDSGEVAEKAAQLEKVACVGAKHSLFRFDPATGQYIGTAADDGQDAVALLAGVHIVDAHSAAAAAAPKNSSASASSQAVPAIRAGNASCAANNELAAQAA